MRRPSLQFYPADWQANPKLKRCSHAEKGLWLDVLCILHDQDEYGVVRWPLREISLAVHARPSALQSLVEKDILKGADVGEMCAPFIYIPRSGRKDGEPVTLIAAQEGPVWYSSRLVRDEYVRRVRAANEPTPKPAPKVPIGEALGDHLTLHPSRAGVRAAASSSSSSSSSSSGSRVVGNVVRPNGDDVRGYPFDHFAVAEYIETLKPEPELSIFQAETIAIGVPDSELSRAVWTNVLTIAKGNGYQTRNAGNMVDRYQNEIRKIDEGKRDSPIPSQSQRTLTVREKMELEEIERKKAGAK